jgi:hypothetical protein
MAEECESTFLSDVPRHPEKQCFVYRISGFASDKISIKMKMSDGALVEWYWEEKTKSLNHGTAFRRGKLICIFPLKHCGYYTYHQV